MRVLQNIWALFLFEDLVEKVDFFFISHFYVKHLMRYFILTLILKDKAFSLMQRFRCVHVSVEKLLWFFCNHSIFKVSEYLASIGVAKQELGVLLAPSFINELREHLYQALTTRLERLSVCFKLSFIFVQNVLTIDEVFDSSATSGIFWCSSTWQETSIHSLRVSL